MMMDSIFFNLKIKQKMLCLLLSFLFLAVIGCSGGSGGNNSTANNIDTTNGDNNTGNNDATSVVTKFSLWKGGPYLRGANIWLTRAYSGQFTGQFGSISIGPVYTQNDFDQLAALGANYVNISHPGLYSESAPFQVDTNAQTSLDNLLSMIQKSNMFAVISFRTGPGRSEFTFARDEVGDWFTTNDLDETIWSETAKQDAWIQMWSYTAQRYKDSSIVVGYDLMVEPNSDEVISGIEGPEDFYPVYKDNMADWNQFYPRIITEIRKVDSVTPIIVGCMGYSAVEWMPYLTISSDSNTLYAIHQYAPVMYTHQSSSETYSYPGTFDTNYDGTDDTFNKTWLDNLLKTIDGLNLTIAVNEFGVIRWAPNASDFLKDSFDLYEQRKWNHALWQWYPSAYLGNSTNTGEFHFMYGPDSSNYANVTDSALIQIIKANWSKNTFRPSTVSFSNSDSSSSNSDSSSSNSDSSSSNSDSSSFQNISLNSSILSVQPMTGIVLWTDNPTNNTDAIQLEFSYLLYNQVVTTSGVYDWTSVDALLDEIKGRKHQAILRFRFVYPGYETSVPDYIKNLSNYNETKGQSEGLDTWFPDWTNSELQKFTLEFYTKFAEKYKNDPRLAFIQTGFGLWSEYHIYDGPFELGKTFPSKDFQESFLNHLATQLANIPWSISIDAASDDYSPLSQKPSLLNLHFGLFDDSFMHENHSGYNETSWIFLGMARYLSAPTGGEFSYYTDYDQQNVLNSDGIYGVTYEVAAAKFHISYMIGNDQLSYQTMARIKEAGIASGYKFKIVSFKASQNASVVEVENSGIAPIYYDAYVAINGIRSSESLKLLAPGSKIVCNVSSGGANPILTIESDHLVSGQKIEYEASLSTN